MAVESGGGISAHATDFKISFNRYTTRGNRRYGNPGKEGEGERERRERDEQHTNPGPWLNCPHQPRNWVGARENRLQIERTSSRWINRVSTPPTSLSTSSWFCLLLLPPLLSSFRATVVFIDAKLRPGWIVGQEWREAGWWRSWIDDFKLLPDPLDGWRPGT